MSHLSLQVEKQTLLGLLGRQLLRPYSRTMPRTLASLYKYLELQVPKALESVLPSRRRNGLPCRAKPVSGHVRPAAPFPRARGSWAVSALSRLPSRLGAGGRRPWPRVSWPPDRSQIRTRPRRRAGGRCPGESPRRPWSPVSGKGGQCWDARWVGQEKLCALQCGRDCRGDCGGRGRRGQSVVLFCISPICLAVVRSCLHYCGRTEAQAT